MKGYRGYNDQFIYITSNDRLLLPNTTTLIPLQLKTDFTPPSVPLHIITNFTYAPVQLPIITELTLPLHNYI